MNAEVAETLRTLLAAVLLVAGAALFAMGLLSYLTPEGGCPAGSEVVWFGVLPAILVALSGSAQPYRVLRIPLWIVGALVGVGVFGVQLGRGCLL